MTSVVRIQRKNGAVVVDCDTYIGRPMYQGGWRLPGSKWANPFRVSAGMDRAHALTAYEAHVRASPELLAALPELRGKRLGCWCRPLPCHGDVLIKLLRERDAPPAEEAASLAPPLADDDPLWAALCE